MLKTSKRFSYDPLKCFDYVKLTGDDLEPPFWIGITKAHLKRSGICPLARILWNMNVSASTRLCLHFFKRIDGIPLGPGDEFEESLSRASRTSSLSNVTLSSYSEAFDWLKNS